MKQHITEEQWHELTELQKYRLLKWDSDNHGYSGRVFSLSGLTIGFMIEYLSSEESFVDILKTERNDVQEDKIQESDLDKWEVTLVSKDIETESIELCDALWEAVKAILSD